MNIPTGTYVALKCDPRQVGRVQAQHWNRQIRVRWQGTGWLSDLDLYEIEVLKPTDDRIDWK